MAENTLLSLAESYLEALRVERRASVHTLDAYERDLARWFNWRDSSKAPTDREMTAYLAYLDSEGRGSATLNRNASVLRSFFAWARSGRHLDDVPEVPRIRRDPTAPPEVIDSASMQKMIDATPGAPAQNARDKAILSTMYAAGLRIAEVADLRVEDLEGDLLRVRGKGRKVRLVPLLDEAKKAIQAWLKWREDWYPESDSGPLFVSNRGGAMSTDAIGKQVKNAAARAGLDPEKVHAHLFRHSAATHLLEGGADLRVVQEFLGHASVATTQRYTQVTKEHLQRAVNAAHPMAKKKSKSALDMSA